MNSSSLFIALLLLVVAAGCSTSPPIIGKKATPQELFQIACEPGKGIRSVEGSIFLKANSSEFSGQFPANVNVVSPDQLKIEITNLLGGTEALIQVNKQHYEITGTRRQKDKQEGYGSWGGIPLQWAPGLFLGKIPCPPAKSDMKLASDAEGQLTIRVPESLGSEAQEFVFGFKNEGGKLWPETLHWTKLNTPTVSVDFKFDDPESETLSPKKWEARSSLGAVKVRWRSRDVSK